MRSRTRTDVDWYSCSKGIGSEPSGNPCIEEGLGTACSWSQIWFRYWPCHLPAAWPWMGPVGSPRSPSQGQPPTRLVAKAQFFLPFRIGKALSVTSDRNPTRCPKYGGSRGSAEVTSFSLPVLLSCVGLVSGGKGWKLSLCDGRLWALPCGSEERIWALRPESLGLESLLLGAMTLVGFLCLSEPVLLLSWSNKLLQLRVLISSSSEIIHVKMPGTVILYINPQNIHRKESSATPFGARVLLSKATLHRGHRKGSSCMSRDHKSGSFFYSRPQLGSQNEQWGQETRIWVQTQCGQIWSLSYIIHQSRMLAETNAEG